MRLLISEYQYARSELPELETPGTPKLLSAKTLGDLEQGNAFGFPSTSPYQNPLQYLQRTITEQAIKIQQRLGQPKLIRSDSQKEKGKDGEIYFMDKLYGWMSLHPESYAYILWLIVVSMAFLYNCWVVPLRSTFLFRNQENLSLWFAVDCCADAIYLLDLMVVKPRIMYLLDGFWIHDTKLTTGKYMRKLQFKMDIFSLLPTDLLYLKFGRNSAWLRLPRFLKIQTFWELYDRLDNILPSGFNVRVARSVVYVLYMIHINACAYYLFSFWREPGGSVTSGKGSAYIQCFYFATKTTTAMGRNPKPDTVEGTAFMSFSWLLGVFVFAILIGQMREHVGTATHLQTEYRNLVDGTLEYMRRFNVPNRLQDKVKLWLAFTSQQQHSLDETTILDTLPPNLRADIAIHVHIATLNKVQIFNNCDPALLRDLVLQLRPVVFLPGDFICRKGEVGKEMYIVKNGQVQVMGGENTRQVLATLTEGSVFGEISLLALEGGNRRTADVRSRGFSNLFILSKNDFDEAILNYPDAQAILKKKAKALVRENAERERLNKIAAEKCQQSMTEQVKSRPEYCQNSTTEDSNNANHRTFQCRVTVHRSMSQ